MVHLLAQLAQLFALEIHKAGFVDEGWGHRHLLKYMAIYNHNMEMKGKWITLSSLPRLL